ncbi:MAG: protein kinase, partial [Planctomycetota bacterium]
MPTSEDELEPIDLVIEEYIDQVRTLEDPPSVDTICDRFPDLGTEIRQILPMLGVLETAAESLNTQVNDNALDTLGGEAEEAQTKPEASSVSFPRGMGRYEWIADIGAGNMGQVFLASDKELGRKVALKLPKTEQKAAKYTERFRREARAMATVDHPNLCQIYDVGNFEGKDYLTMEYIEGQSLDQILREHGSLSEKSAVALVRQIASALDALHGANILHRDIKPSNVMVSGEGVPYLMDFGLALPTEIDTELTGDGDIVGTPAYVAPELLEAELGEIGTHSDIYSLGILLFELTAGRRPFAGSAFHVMRKAVTEPAPSLRTTQPRVSPGLDRLCAQMLERRPTRRLSSAQEVERRLQELDPDNDKSLGIGGLHKSIPGLVLAALICLVVVIVQLNGQFTINPPDGSGSSASATQPIANRMAHFRSEEKAQIDSVRDVELGDLDGDGDLDVFLVLYLGRPIVLLNDGEGNFLQGPKIADPEEWRNWDSCLGDVDGDEDLDALVTRNGIDRLWLNNG